MGAGTSWTDNLKRILWSILPSPGKILQTTKDWVSRSSVLGLGKVQFKGLGVPEFSSKDWVSRCPGVQFYTEI
jgi:hypothetical protein